MRRVLVIGSANVDLTMGVERMPRAGETVSGGTFLQVMGGKGANQAVAARRAGAAVTLLTCVGADAHGEAVLAAMRTEGIDLAGTRTSECAATGVAVILYDRAGENSIAVASGANLELRPEDAAAAVTSFGHNGLLLLQNELAPATREALFAAARATGVSVLLNAAPAEGLRLEALAGDAIHLLVNEHEAAALLGWPAVEVADAGRAAEMLRAAGFRSVVVTLGETGCCVAAAEGMFMQPAMPVHAVDATAAGDTFCGALAAALVMEADDRWNIEALRRAVRFATAAAALATTRPGAQPSIPTLAEIQGAASVWV